MSRYVSSTSEYNNNDVPHQNDTNVARFTAEAHLFALVSHVYWCVWAVLQAKWSALDFDYLAYALKRWARLDDTKAGAVSVALAVAE